LAEAHHHDTAHRVAPPVQIHNTAPDRRADGNAPQLGDANRCPLFGGTYDYVFNVAD
jgi:hypothetical protein